MYVPPDVVEQHFASKAAARAARAAPRDAAGAFTRIGWAPGSSDGRYCSSPTRREENTMPESIVLHRRRGTSVGTMLLLAPAIQPARLGRATTPQGQS
jgi:hypothetical protein